VVDCFDAVKRLTIHGTEIRHIYDQLFLRYGDGSTVYHCVRYVLQTLAYFGVVSNRKMK